MSVKLTLGIIAFELEVAIGFIARREGHAVDRRDVAPLDRVLRNQRSSVRVVSGDLLGVEELHPVQHCEDGQERDCQPDADAP